ncbi:hypothetical protein IIA79_05185 [bacterium]|nr:hypothetical protein [bacterium]
MAIRIKRYEARYERLDELLARIEAEMGPDAELETRQFLRGRLLGLFGGQRMVEIVASLEVNGDAQDSTAPVLQPSPAVDIKQRQLAEPRRMERPRLDVSADDPLHLPPIAQQAAARSGLREPYPARSGRREPSLPRTEAAPAIDLRLAGGDARPTSEDSRTSQLRESISDLKDTVTLLVEKMAGEEAHPTNMDAERSGQREPYEAASVGESYTAPTAHTIKPKTEVAAAHLAALEPGASLSSVQHEVYERLLDWDIGSYDAIELIQGALAQCRDRSAERVCGNLITAETGVEELTRLIKRGICSDILLGGGIELRKPPPGKVVALVGATGVGKTTTIAKLAAQFALTHGKRVSIVSLDNYRIAAAEQLRTYAEIMGLGLDIVFNGDELETALAQRRYDDLVLIDTAGRSPLNTRQIEELRGIFSTHPPDEVHLVIAAPTKGDDLQLILKNFAPLSYNYLIISKLDETKSLGCIYNINKYCRLPIHYFTVGQSVPEDIRTAELPFVKAWIEEGRIA